MHDTYRAALRRLHAAVNAETKALRIYFDEVGVEHDDGCPEDDTCNCAHLVGIYAATEERLRAMTEAHDVLLRDAEIKS